MSKRKDDLWRPEDYSDEPRTDGKTDLDLFRESCEAADRARRREEKAVPRGDCSPVATPR
jgi:hypothetical protein